MDGLDSALAGCDPVVRSLAVGTIARRYRTWGWGEGVAQYGLLTAAQLIGSEQCLAEVGEFIHANAMVMPDRIDHVMPALPSLLYYEETKDELGLVLATRVVDMLRTHPRSRHGAFVASPTRSAWVDYIYETVPFLCHYDRIVGSTECRDWAVEQTIAYLMSCWNARDGLFSHVYYDDVGVALPFYWARANGWVALALVEIGQLFPAEWGIRPVIRRVFEQLMERLVSLQRPSGLWNTALCDARTYEEVSASVMISMALRQGVRLGWLNDVNLESADRAWRAFTGRIDPAGGVTGVSAETPPGDSEFYGAIDTGVYPWGQGFGLLAALDRFFGERFSLARLGSVTK